ncbi:MAG: hypothetical protein IKE91_08770 [Clostridia bacterium]|nr:hypothetical protein [Clostridia bacterium]
MILNAKVIVTKKFVMDGKHFVTIQGIMNDKGMFQQTVREELIPDVLEGKEIALNYDVGIATNFKPYLKLVSINIK